ncbi:hypothetical protein E4U41_003473 [Claviceps citrina]|nr:hypothetical protein E4U41_003473 [Claviceps citrina]
MDQSIIRITKELSDIQRGSDLAIAVACRDIDVRNVRALIMGPHETPYEFGFFEVNIGSLLSANPYENEPGYEAANSPLDKVAQKHYAQKIRHETLRISIIQRLEIYLGITRVEGIPVEEQKKPEVNDAEDTNVAFEPFKDLCKRRFLWYYQSYLASIETGKFEVREGQAFVRMPFEPRDSNIMDGKFNYPDLERRLRRIKAALDAETDAWAKEGLEAVAKESTVAANLRHQYRQVASYFRTGDMPHHVTLEDGNPFVWVITYFGRPMTNLDGGLFCIRMNFSPRFPDEQPRVRFETKIFHHHVAPDGTACYVPNPLKREDVKSHIEAIISILEEDEPSYDPREIINPEATKLFWGNGRDDKKLYNRRLRRSVQQSME